MRVAFLAAECEPWAKTGGLADVVDALARAIGRVGDGEVDAPVDVFLPRYRGIPVPSDVARRQVARVPDPLAPEGVTDVTVITVPADGYRLRLVDHPPAFDRDGLYGDDAGDYPDNAWRFGLLSRAVIETLRTDERRPDVLHLHDWHACAAVLQRDRWYVDDPAVSAMAVLLTLHNLAYHGWTPATRLRELGFAVGDPPVDAGADGLDLLRAGIERAELVNTVSPGFAAEALTPEYGMGLDGTLRSLGDRFTGILNGLDAAVWDPATDRDIAATYSRDDLRGKATARFDLLERVGFDGADGGSVLGMIGRLDRQKGFDLLAAAAPSIVERGARLIVQGAGDPEQLAALRRLAAERPDRVALVERFDRVMARRIYAGADLFLMPSRFEPCGQGQMIALRYGTPPIVRRTGGLADTVVDDLERPGEGTGFVFGPATPEALLDAVGRAIERHAAGGDEWAALQRRGMALDFDWATGSAPRYLDAYGRAVAIRRENDGGRGPGRRDVSAGRGP